MALKFLHLEENIIQKNLNKKQENQLLNILNLVKENVNLDIIRKHVNILIN